MRAAWTILVGMTLGCATTTVPKDVDTDTDTDVVDTDVVDTDTQPIDTDALYPFDDAAIPETVPFEPGVFTMGSPPTEVGHTSLETAHQVTLTYPFELGTYEVTQGQFLAWTTTSPSYWSGCRRCPVESVTWHQAAAFTNLLSVQAELQACYDCTFTTGVPACTVARVPTRCTGYRLPTEAEWEYAARSSGTVIGATTGGGSLAEEDDLTLCISPMPLDDRSDLGDVAWFCGNSDGTPGNTTHRVGDRAPTADGVYDLLGNVWEWTHDRWREVLDQDEIDPTTQGVGSNESKVVRGGGWDSAPRHTRIAFRTLGTMEGSNDNMGFRIARTLQITTDPPADTDTDTDPP